MPKPTFLACSIVLGNLQEVLGCYINTHFMLTVFGFSIVFGHKLIGVDSSRQTNTNIPKKITFIGKLEEDDGEAMFFITEKQQKIVLNFSLDSLFVTE